MAAAVVYESMFGNTQAIAEAIAEGLSTTMRVEFCEVGAAPAAVGGGVDLLVVGAPTHAFGLSRPSTRASAAEQAERPLVSPGIGLREWLEALPYAVEGVAAAAFDTRGDHPRWLRLTPSAAGAAEKRLRSLGFEAAAPAASFSVADTRGPLRPGEAERAREWGVELAHASAHLRAA